MDYLKALEEERKKILVFERELPLSLQLVTHAIETCKKQIKEVVVGSEEIISGRPILEEFILLRPSHSSSDEDNHNQSKKIDGSADKKPNWLRSVQLWNQEPSDQSAAKKDGVMKPIAVNATRNHGAFHPFEREKVNIVKTPVPVVAAQASSTTENNSNREEKEMEKEKEKEGNSQRKTEKEKEKEKEKEGNSQRKTRRCWSPELHKRFLNALQQLGGSHVATPKQIRELMNVDGLTNDEVKSHLQKYRLHTTRRPTTPAVQSCSNGSPPQPQIVLVGSLWLPPPEYPTTTAVPLNGIYAPVASLPSELCSQSKQKTGKSPTALVNYEPRSEHMDTTGRTNSDSSATLSSSQTTTVSPPLRVC